MGSSADHTLVPADTTAQGEDAFGDKKYQEFGLQINPVTKKVIIQLLKVKRHELTDEEKSDLRIFYWAAFYGRTKTINLMIRHRRWSPYMKSFLNQSIMTAAVRGERLHLVKRLIANYEYRGLTEAKQRVVEKAFFNKDAADNNCLHFAYSIDIPEIRAMVKADGHIDPAKSERRNQRGLLPKQMRHAKKVELSDSDDDAHDVAGAELARSQTL